MTERTARRFAERVIVGGWLLGAATACRMMQNPYRDELAAAPPVTTASVEAARSRPAERRSTQRPFHETVIGTASGKVYHGPLYFETAGEDPDPADDRFAWSGEDHLRILTDPTRFLFNAVLFPVSVVVTPPWQFMVSDGVPDRSVVWVRHDARPGDPAAETHAVPPRKQAPDRATDEKSDTKPHPSSGDGAPER